MGPNERAPGHGGNAQRFPVGRAWLAGPEYEHWAEHGDEQDCDSA